MAERQPSKLNVAGSIPVSRSISIRPEQPGDAPAIAAINLAAFGREDEGRIVEAIHGTDAWIPGASLVAVDAETIVGHLLLSRAAVVQVDGTEEPIGLIGPVAVMPERQGQGIGAALMVHAIEIATELELPAICLLGHAGYYPRFGFTPARAIGLEPPHPWPDANWLALPLPAHTPDLRGRVRLPHAFG